MGEHGAICLNIDDLLDGPGIPFSFDFLYWSIKNSSKSLLVILNNCSTASIINGCLDGIKFDIMALLSKLYNMTARICKKIYGDNYFLYKLTILLYPFCGTEPILLPDLTHVICDSHANRKNCDVGAIDFTFVF